MYFFSYCCDFFCWGFGSLVGVPIVFHRLSIIVLFDTSPDWTTHQQLIDLGIKMAMEADAKCRGSVAFSLHGAKNELDGFSPIR